MVQEGQRLQSAFWVVNRHQSFSEDHGPWVILLEDLIDDGFHLVQVESFREISQFLLLPYRIRLQLIVKLYRRDGALR